MIVQSDRRVPGRVQKLQMQLRNRYGGLRHAGELMVLEAGLKATTITPNAMEAAFASLSKLSRDRVFAMFRVPPKLLGISDGRAATTSRPTSSACSTPRRCSRSWRSSSGGSCARSRRRGTSTSSSTTATRCRRRDQVKLAGDFSKIPGVTVREVRGFLELPPTGDDSYDDLVLNLPGDNGVPGQRAMASRTSHSQGGGRPPNGNNTTAFGTVGGGNRLILSRALGLAVRARRARRARIARRDQARLDELAGKAVTLQTPKPASTGRYLDSADVRT